MARGTVKRFGSSAPRDFAWLVVLSMAACQAPAATMLPTQQPLATPAPSPTPIPWLLLGDGIPDDVVLEAEAVAIAAGLEVRRQPIPVVSIVPPGLTVVVAQAAEVAPVEEAWSRAGIWLLVLGVSSSQPGDRLSILNPEPLRDQEGFLAGVAAGLASSSLGVGLEHGDGSESAEAFRVGFWEGVRYACARCRLEPVDNSALPPFGVDVVGLPPGSTVAETAPPDGAPWIVVASGVPPGGWASRRVVELSVSSAEVVAAALQALLDGAPGSMWTPSVENRGLGIGWVNPQALSPGRERLLRQAEDRLAQGLLVVGGGD